MIQCLDVIKIYQNKITGVKTPALRGIDLIVHNNELLSIIGPSGSGKTTLLNLLAGITQPTSGSIIVNGLHLEKLSPNELVHYRRDNIGFVEQFPEKGLFLDNSVRDNVLFYSTFAKSNLNKAEDRISEILNNLDIKELEKRKVKTLSGGEMTRIALACALCKNTPIILCDEPTGQLDSANAEKIKDLLQEISTVFNKTIIVVSHDQRFHQGVDKTCKIENGRVSSIISLKEYELYREQTTFPLRFKRQIDSSFSVPLPKLVMQSLDLKNEVAFEIAKTGETKILNPKGTPPRKIDLKSPKTLVREIQLTDRKTITGEIAIQFIKVSKTYQQKGKQVIALEDITFEIKQNEMVFIIGPSGSGKTTLLKLLTGIETPTEGDVTIFGTKLPSLSDASRAKFRLKHFGIVTQQGNLHPYLPIKDNLILKKIIAKKKAIKKNTLHDKQNKVLTKFYIESKSDNLPSELSGGELQRAVLSTVVFQQPSIMVLDEPTANLDSDLALKMMAEILKLQRKMKLTIIIATHDLNLVQKNSKIIKLLDGKIEKVGFLKQ